MQRETGAVIIADHAQSVHSMTELIAKRDSAGAFVHSAEAVGDLLDAMQAHAFEVGKSCNAIKRSLGLPVPEPK